MGCAPPGGGWAGPSARSRPGPPLSPRVRKTSLLRPKSRLACCPATRPTRCPRAAISRPTSEGGAPKATRGPRAGSLLSDWLDGSVHRGSADKARPSPSPGPTRPRVPPARKPGPEPSDLVELRSALAKAPLLLTALPAEPPGPISQAEKLRAVNPTPGGPKFRGILGYTVYTQM